MASIELMKYIIEIVKWICILFIIIAFCITVHVALRMREAYLRGKMMRKRCGEEYYEAETIRYQIYDEWFNKKANEELGASSFILIIATMIVVGLYIGKFMMDNKGNWQDSTTTNYSKLGFTRDLSNNWLKLFISVITILGFLAYCLYTAGLLNPNKGLKSYYVDDDLPIANRIIGIVIHLLFLLIVLPILLIVVNKDKGNPTNKGFWDVFKIFFPEETQYAYAMLLLLLVGLLIFAFINMGFGVYIKDKIHDDYFDEQVNTENNITLPTHILQKVINNVVNTTKGNPPSIASESTAKSTNQDYATEKYKFYKMIYNGIKDVDKPVSISENEIKKGPYAQDSQYKLMFKYILHSKTMDKLLRDSEVLGSPSVIPNVDVTDKYKNMQTSDLSLSDAVNSFYLAVMIIFGFIIGIIALLIYRNLVKSSPMYIIPIIIIIFILLLGSLIYAYMSGALLG